LRNRLERARSRECDFKRVDPARQQGFANGKDLAGLARANNRDQTRFYQQVDDFKAAAHV